MKNYHIKYYKKHRERILKTAEAQRRAKGIPLKIYRTSRLGYFNGEYVGLDTSVVGIQMPCRIATEDDVSPAQREYKKRLVDEIVNYKNKNDNFYIKRLEKR